MHTTEVGTLHTIINCEEAATQLLVRSGMK